jgi:hypothetical protein
MYTKEIFGKILKAKVLQKQCVADIGHWSYSVYLEHISDIDLEFRDILLTLNTMEDGPEFSFIYEELEQIANDLISGKEVNL